LIGFRPARPTPHAEAGAKPGTAPPPPTYLRVPTPDVESLLKKFAQSSQLGANAAYIEDLYEQYLVNPDSVGPKWKSWFDGFKGREAGDVPHSAIQERVAAAGRAARDGSAGTEVVDSESSRKQGSVLKLITAYRSRGHLQADIDPLGTMEKLDAPDLGLPFHGLSDGDLDEEFRTGPGGGSTSTFGGPERMRLRELLGLLRSTYCGSIGAEFMHIP